VQNIAYEGDGPTLAIPHLTFTAHIIAYFAVNNVQNKTLYFIIAKKRDQDSVTDAPVYTEVKKSTGNLGRPTV